MTSLLNPCVAILRCYKNDNVSLVALKFKTGLKALLSSSRLAEKVNNNVGQSDQPSEAYNNGRHGFIKGLRSTQLRQTGIYDPLEG
mmetsp:Transcript_24832/g.36743  ORF Transcript_24832/g.36743 Transcript_24832/m.36743 type:complete len:86 (+) Transcript_24832:80-337(+)